MKPFIGSEMVLGYLFLKKNKSGYGFRLFFWPSNIEPLYASGAASSPYNKVTGCLFVCLYRRISLTDMVILYIVASHMFKGGSWFITIIGECTEVVRNFF